MKSVVQPLSALQRQLPADATAGPFEPAALSRETLGDRVAAELRALLIAGRLAPGDKLSLRKVAEALGVSMMPVREAVSRLAAEGALEVLPGRAVRVPAITLSQFRELTQLRLVVEGFAVEEAARRAGPDDLREIARHEAAFRRVANTDPLDSIAAVSANRDLHYAIYQAAAMPTLVGMIGQLWLKIGPILNLDMRSDPKRLEGGHALEAHAALLAALEAGDGAAARRALDHDIRSAARHIEASGNLRDS